MFEIIDVFVWHEGLDSGLGSIMGFYTSSRLAEERAKGTGAWGGDGVVRRRKAIVIGEKTYLLDEDYTDPIDINEQRKKAEEQIAKKALSKLTEEERRVLKLT